MRLQGGFPKKVVSVGLNPQLLERFDDYCEIKNINRSEAIQNLMLWGLLDNRKHFALLQSKKDPTQYKCFFACPNCGKFGIIEFQANSLNEIGNGLNIPCEECGTTSIINFSTPEEDPSFKYEPPEHPVSTDIGVVPFAYTQTEEFEKRMEEVEKENQERRRIASINEAKKRLEKIEQDKKLVGE